MVIECDDWSLSDSDDWSLSDRNNWSLSDSDDWSLSVSHSQLTVDIAPLLLCYSTYRCPGIRLCHL